MEWKCVADIEGAWKVPSVRSSVIDRCREFWHTPAVDLSNEMLATYLRERIALQLIIPEARRRFEKKFNDHTEQFDGELANALQDAELFESKRGSA